MAARMPAVPSVSSMARPFITGPANFGRSVHAQVIWFGDLLVFVGRVVMAIPLVLRHYRKEMWRLLAEITFGGGVLAVAASTVVVASFLAAVVGVQLGISGLQGLDLVSLAPLAGLLSSFGNTRELAPLLTAFGLAAQMGCRFTAQLGAMRVSEEIDALEVMSVPSLPYLVTTRLLAALICVVPLYLLALSGAFLASKWAVLIIAHQGTGTYQHYFYLFLDRRDIYYSVLKVIVFCILITILHCYYGYNATGGPEGVGRATGRAIRASVVAISISDMLMTLLFWGVSTPVRVSG
jgi:phospholipid/cholesterol/gamma-HCH transport system permease protein